MLKKRKAINNNRASGQKEQAMGDGTVAVFFVEPASQGIKKDTNRRAGMVDVGKKTTKNCSCQKIPFRKDIEIPERTPEACEEGASGDMIGGGHRWWLVVNG